MNLNLKAILNYFCLRQIQTAEIDGGEKQKMLFNRDISLSLN